MKICPLCKQRELAFGLTTGEAGASCVCGFRFSPKEQLDPTDESIYNEIMALVAGKAVVNESVSRVPDSCYGCGVYECGEEGGDFKCKFKWTHRSIECLEHFGV